MPIKVRVGQTDAIKILSSAGGGSIQTQNAVNVIGGIASVTQLSVSGISTLANVGAGIITATSFVGPLTGIADTALSLSGTPNIDVGVATATSFVGPLTGDVAGTADFALGLSGTPNINVGSVDASSLNITGLTTLSANGGITTTGGDLYVGGNLFVNQDITLDEISARSLNISGISTFQEFVRFDKSVSIGGTLTYEDVTNIDSVGLITARKGIRITNGGLIVNAGIATFSAIATFTNNVFVDGTLTAGLIDGGEF
jgi:hypothetical protein